MIARLTRSGFLALLSCGSIVAASATALAATPVYVDGNSLCAGLTPCFATIQLGIRNAGPAPAVVNVFPGSYAESVDLSLMGNAIGGSPGDLTLRTVDGAGVPAAGTASILPTTGPALTNSVVPFPGNITIAGFTVQSPDDAGISLVLQGTLTVSGVVSDGNGAEGLAASIQNGDLRVSASSFSNGPSSSGITFKGPTDVTFDRVTADGNAGSGADFTMSGTLRIMHSSFSRNTNGNGLRFNTATDVVFDAVLADENQNTGADFSMTGTLAISDSSFSRTKNGGGLVFSGATDVTFDGVVADANQNSGADFSMTGGLRIANSSFSNAVNGGGLIFSHPTGVVFDAVVADANQNTGADFSMSGVVRITNSSFSRAKNGGGFVFSAASDATFDHVVADGNQNSGGDFSVNGTLRISNSSFGHAKNGDGLRFSSPTDVILDGVLAEGNSGNGVSASLLNARITRSRFDDNGAIGVDLGPLSADAAISLTCTDIAGNMGDGLRLVSAATVYARHDYWGSPSGPTYPTNPGGTGDTIVDGSNGGAGVVLFRPFLTVPSAESAYCNQGAPALGPWGLAVLLVGLLFLPGWRLARREPAARLAEVSGPRWSRHASAPVRDAVALRACVAAQGV